jgi:hypothetical protein
LIETVVAMAIPVLGGGILAVLAWQQRRDLGRTWLAAAAQCGLEDVTLRRFGTLVRHLEARRGPLAVRLAFVRAEDLARPGTRIVVEGLPRDLEIGGPSEPFGWIRTRLPVGDDKFDAILSADGRRDHVLAVLDAATRDRAREIFAAPEVGEFVVKPNANTKPSASLVNGRLTVDCYQGRGPRLEPLLRSVLEFADALIPGDSLVPRLARNVRRDPEPAVRLNNLRELVEGSRGHPDAEEALRAALADGDEIVQLEAAVALGSAGREVLLQIASREWSSDAAAARAVSELRSALPVEQARTILAYALRTRRLETARACIESLGHRRSERADTFARVLALEDGALAAAAARALGRVGDVTVVPLLTDAQERLARDKTAREAIAEAIAAIQTRALGARAGQLSLAGDASGQLSLTRDEAGRVSLDASGDDTQDGPAR